MLKLSPNVLIGGRIGSIRTGESFLERHFKLLTCLTIYP